ncbi:MAG: hypothetical protein ACR2NW_10630 [Thermodesulfobacteriota bacterium]
MNNISSEAAAFDNAGVDYIVFDPETNSNAETIDMIWELSERIIKAHK